MKWSWKLGRFAGIDTHVHATFMLVVLWAAWAAYEGAGTGLAAALGVVFLLAVFGSVLLHELGHALMARRFGIATRRIVLLPIGGVAQLEGQPRTPRQELAIALAGPAVNLVIAAAIFVVGGITGLSSYGLIGALMLANLGLAVFNLLPAFPMDGGRALRALLATRLGGPRATEIAVQVGKSAAIVFGIVGLFISPILVLVAVFVWFAARAEGKLGRFVYGGGAATDFVHGTPDWSWTPPARRTTTQVIAAPFEPPSSFSAPTAAWAAPPHPARRIVVSLLVSRIAATPRSDPRSR
jgi:Zn-dependent protease